MKPNLPLLTVVIVAFVMLVVVMILPSRPFQARAETAQSSAGCACTVSPTHGTKFLIFWKEKEQEGDKEAKVFKISDKLYDHITDAWKIVPPNAAEVRIITVRLD